MAASTCKLCMQHVEPEDYYRELDCSRNCIDNVFHEPCIERYLRKHGRGTDQKTGFDCPATLSNGKPCLGTIKKTHMRLPTNAKKKEQNKQAAIAVNVMVNSARGTAPVVSNQKAKDASVVKQPVTKATGKIVKLVSGQRPPVVICNRNTSLPAAAASQRSEGRAEEDDFTNFRQIGKRSSKRDDGESDTDDEIELMRLRKGPSDNVSKVQVPEAPSGNDIAATRAASSKSATANAWAVSKNSAMAPEPVVRQPVSIPGWTDTSTNTKKGSSSVSNLAEQRALVATLRAQQSSGSSSASASRAASAAGGGSASKSVIGTGCMDKDLSPEPTGTASVAGGQPPSDITTRMSAASAAHQQHQKKDQQQDQQPPMLHRSSSCGGDAASLPPSLSASPDTSDPASPAVFEPEEAQKYPQAADADADPIVEYDPIFSREDNSVVVLEQQTGLYVLMEDVYGADPELIGFRDETGAVTYYIVVRASFAATAALAKQRLVLQPAAEPGVCMSGDGAGGSAVGWTGVEGGLGAVAPDGKGAGERSATGGMMWGLNGAGASGSIPSPEVAAEAEEGGVDEDELDDLLALCLGK